MLAALGIAYSGLAAQTKRVEASASNVANLQNTGAIPDRAFPSGSGVAAGDQPQAYQPLGVAQSPTNPGTRATFTPITPSYLPEYAPDADFADAQGFIATPNVDPAQERINQISAKRAYGANIAVVRTQDEMLKSLLDSKV